MTNTDSQIFQNDINLIAYSSFIDDKFSLKENEKIFRKSPKLSEVQVLINKDSYR